MKMVRSENFTQVRFMIIYQYHTPSNYGLYIYIRDLKKSNNLLCKDFIIGQISLNFIIMADIFELRKGLII